jgi:hypothetical protein
MAFDLEMIRKVYADFGNRVEAARKVVGRPLTLTEKILYAHLWESPANSSADMDGQMLWRSSSSSHFSMTCI